MRYHTQISCELNKMALLGLPGDALSPEELRAELIKLINDGKKLKAIATYRRAKKKSLKESYGYIDKLIDDQINEHLL